MHHPYSPMCLLVSRPGIPWFGERVLPLDMSHLLPVMPLIPVVLCWYLPLWGNLPQKASPRWAGGYPGLEFWQPEFLGCRALRTLGNAFCAQESLNVILQASDQTVVAGHFCFLPGFTRTAWPGRISICPDCFLIIVRCVDH